MSRAEPQPPIEHLLFSTRAARPRSGTEFNREVVASSPGVPEPARQELARLADMTGPVLSQPELPPLWAFRRIGEERWLVVRAVSLGLYRKGHHQLLIHGAVLPREVVDLLEGNPFLLASEAARKAGFRFAEEHPEGRDELAPMTIDPAFGSTARRLCTERLARLSEAFTGLDPAFPALFDRLHRARTGDEEDRRTVALAPTRALHSGVIEWLLLHLHPADRAELSFHTRYAYEQALPFDLVGAAPDEVADLRRRLRADVDAWTEDETGRPAGPAGRGGGGNDGGGSATLGERVRQVREREPELLVRTLDEYYLTLFSGRHGTDVRRNPFHPLEAEQADLCLRAALGLDLTEAEAAERLRLSFRGDRSLIRHAGDLGAAWRQGTEAFEEHLRRLTSAADELRRLDLDRMPPVTRPEERLGLLALLPVLRPEVTEPDAAGDQPSRAWSEIVPPGSFRDLLALLRTPREVEIGERVVGPWIDGLLRVGAEEGGTAWAPYLAWLGRAGRPAAPVASRVERALDALPDDVALPGYRRLERVAAEAGLTAFALRILFEREIPRLPPAAARVRLADGVAWALRAEEDAAADPVLAPSLSEPESAAVVLEALADRLLAADEPAAVWARVHRLLRSLPGSGVVLPRAATPAAGAFVARLALSPLAERAAEAVDRLDAIGPDASGRRGRVEERFRFRDGVIAAAATAIAGTLLDRPPRRALGSMPRGLCGLVALRLEDRPLGEPDASVDRALLAALLPALVLCGPEDDGGAQLRSHLDRYLERLVALDRLDRAVDPAGPWRHLLLDELRAAPARHPEDDPRHRAYLHLAWRRWAAAVDRRDRTGRHRAAVALARAFPGSRASRPDPRTHRALLERSVPPPHHPEAHHLLASLLPAVDRGRGSGRTMRRP